VLDLLVNALRESHDDQTKAHEEALKRLQAEHDRLQHRIHVMYIDKLDGRVESDFFHQMSDKWRSEQNRLLQEIQRHQEGDRDYLEDGVQLLRLAQTAGRHFAKGDAHEQRRLLDYVLSNSSWKDGRISASFRQPFNLIAETVAMAARSNSRARGEIASRQSWLGD
jgi:site-specific DNA recombinase